MSQALLSVVLGLATAGALPQETAEINLFPETEYVSGRAGLVGKVKGILAIGPDEISLQTKDGKVVLSIPINIVTGVSVSTETDPGSFGRKMALGVFSSRREEYLTIKTETAEAAEAIVLKCKKKTSEGMEAKIEFFLKKAVAPSPQPK